MAKNSVTEWSTVSSGNGDIAGLTLGVNMPPSYVNNAMQEMMAQIKQWKDGYTDPITGLPVYQSATVANIDIVGQADIQGVLELNGSTGTLGQVMVSQGASASPVWGNSFPAGGIIIWSGSKISVPSGWHICDGTNGTPNLKGRFVVGAGTTYSVNDAGGSPNTPVVSHTHGATSTVLDPGHKHAIGRAFNITPQGSGPTIGSTTDFSVAVQSTQPALTGVSVSTTITPTGGPSNNMNLPPYYALCYIMKL